MIKFMKCMIALSIGIALVMSTLVVANAQKVTSEHYLVAYGDHREKLEDLCKILGIEVI